MADPTRSAATPSQSDIDGGRAPARTMGQLASALGQDICGIGARLYSLRLILDGESVHGAVEVSDEAKESLTGALDGLGGHLKRLGEKVDLAREAESNG